QETVGIDLERPVDDVERAGGTGARVADDDRRPHHSDRHLPHGRLHHQLRLELRLLVAVPKALSDVEIVFAEQVRMTAAHARGAHVTEAPQPPVSARAAGHVEDAQCALTVDASRLGERQIEPDRGGAVNDVRRRPYQTVERSPLYAEVVRGHVTGDRVPAVAHALATLVA